MLLEGQGCALSWDPPSKLDLWLLSLQLGRKCLAFCRVCVCISLGGRCQIAPLLYYLSLTCILYITPILQLCKKIKA